MKIRQIILLAALSFLSTITRAQKEPSPVYLRSGTISASDNISEPVVAGFNRTALRVNDRSFALIQFYGIPSEAERKELSNTGIELLDYIPENAYTVSITGDLKIEILLRAGAKALLQLTPQQKLHSLLLSGQIPSHASKVPGTVDVWFSFPKTFSASDITELLLEKNFEIISRHLVEYRIIGVRSSSAITPASSPERSLATCSRSPGKASLSITPSTPGSAPRAADYARSGTPVSAGVAVPPACSATGAIWAGDSGTTFQNCVRA